MKKLLKIILIFLLVLFILVIGCIIVFTAYVNYKNNNYIKYSTPDGAIEAKYTAPGNYDVSFEEFDAGDDISKKYSVWYPSEMKESSNSYPMVVIANGTGMKASSLSAVYNHLSSWGFIVVGNDDKNSRTGTSSATTLDFMLGLNEDKASDFFGKIDTESLGIAGHSQGGVGAINAVTQQKNGSAYKVICAQSVTSSAVANALNLLDGELGGG